MDFFEWKVSWMRLGKPHKRGLMAPELPKEDPQERLKPRSVEVKEWIWKRLKEIGHEADPKRSRPFVLNYFLEWAIKDYDAAQARKKR